MNERIFSSFRDPAGFVFRHTDGIYRQINQCYAGTYERIRETGIFTRLIKTGKILPFDELEKNAWPSTVSDDAYAVIKPEAIPFISYPYEWSFGQLKAAALLTLDVHLKALEVGLTLKDASAYNIQFKGGKPVFIDHLSFDLAENYPVWPGYGQFCRHFLAPLSLISKKNIPVSALQLKYIDGIPLDIAAQLLPFRCRFSLSLFSHIFIHAKLQQKYADSAGRKKSSNRRLTTAQLKSIAQMLYSAIENMQWKPSQRTEWGDYYSDTNYTPRAMEAKQSIICEMAAGLKPGKVLDIGGNDGTMIRLVAPENGYAVCCDIDPIAVERCYRQSQSGARNNVLPLIQDLTNPSPGLGFASAERDSFISRCKADLVLALALIHHLAISNNLPFEYIAQFLAQLGKHCLVEFVPKEDSQVQRLLATREDIFPFYNSKEFEKAFVHYFSLIEKKDIQESKRILYLFTRR
jgi:hypothetical protein